MDPFEKEQIKKMNATLKEIAKGFARLANERNGYAVLPTIEMTTEEEKGEEDGAEE